MVAHGASEYCWGVQAHGVELRLAELIAALSVATDLGGGQPIGHGQPESLLRVWARRRTFGKRTGSTPIYLAMLRYIGCTAGAHVVVEGWRRSSAM